MTEPPIAADRRPAWDVSLLEIVAVFVLAFAAYLAISRYLLVAPDTVVTLRNNVLFETDSGVRLRYLTDPGTRAASRLEFLQHPAFFLFWRPIGLGLAWLLRGILSPAAGSVLAAQLMVCGAAAAGAAAVWGIARGVQAPRSSAAIVLVLMVLATVTVLVVVPEHWAMAQGLMLIACWGMVGPGRPGPARLTWLGILCVLIAGTTITNAMFGLLLLFTLAPALGIRIPIRRRAPWLVAAAVPVLILAGWGLSRLPHVAGFLNLRLIENPARAIAYVAFGLIGPIVGPVPHEGVLREHLTLSYEPFSFGMYSTVQWIGVIAWAGLLLVCAWHAVRDPGTRRIAGFLLAWIAFNLTFHNLWGDEFFLYSAHWAWALIVLALLGLRHLRGRLILPLAAAIAAGQLTTLLTIGTMLRGS